MKTGLIEIFLAVGVGVSALAICAVCVVGLVVWLAGSRRVTVSELRRRG